MRYMVDGNEGYIQYKYKIVLNITRGEVSRGAAIRPYKPKEGENNKLNIFNMIDDNENVD